MKENNRTLPQPSSTDRKYMEGSELFCCHLDDVGDDDEMVIVMD